MDATARPAASALLARLARELDLDRRLLPVTDDAESVPLPSALAVGELAWCSVAVAGAALSPDSGLAPDPQQIAAAYRSDRSLLIDGEHPDPWSTLSRFWPTAAGWIRTHGNYPHHAAALRSALGLAGDAGADDIARALSALKADTAAARIRTAGGVAVEVRRERPEEDAALRRHPLVDITRVGDAARRPLHRVIDRAPLAGVRVLDLTRVIAGPVATRTLAHAGADVLRIDPPFLTEPEWQHLDTGHGKRSALLDVVGDAERFEALLADADVVVLGYRPAGLRRLGLDPSALALRHPHLVIAQLSAWPGDGSPRGFDSIVQAECGIAWIESADGVAPGALPAQALDHSAGYLLAAGVATALRRRARVGGSWRVGVSLRRVAAELLGMPRGGADPASDRDPELQTFDTGGSRIRTVGPAVRWRGAPDRYAAPRPWGADVAEW